VVFGLWIRKDIDETPEFKEVQKKGEVAKIPLIETMRTHWKEVLIAIGGKVVETAPFYIFGTFIISYATNNLGFDSTKPLNAVTFATIVTTILIPIMGHISDTVGRIPLYNWGTIFMILFAFPYFWILEMKTDLSLYLA